MHKKVVLPTLLVGTLLAVFSPASALARDQRGEGRGNSGGSGYSHGQSSPGARGYSGGHGYSADRGNSGGSGGRAYSGRGGYSGGQAFSGRGYSGGQGYNGGRDYDRRRGWGDHDRYRGGRGFSFGDYGAPYSYCPILLPAGLLQSQRLLRSMGQLASSSPELLRRPIRALKSLPDRAAASRERGHYRHDHDRDRDRDDYRRYR